MNRKDRRVQKTINAIQEAMLALMFEKQYNKITIQNIIDQANVGRSTFYSHFTDKEDLLLSCIEFLLEMIKDFVTEYVEQTTENDTSSATVDFFAHLQEHNRLLKGLIHSENSDVFFNRIQVHVNQKIEPYFSAKTTDNVEGHIPLNILVNHISGTLINMIKWWIDNNMCYSPAQMDKYFRMLISPCIDFALE